MAAEQKARAIRILQKITEMPNVKMLLGNHEYMMMKALVSRMAGLTMLTNLRAVF